MNASPPSLLHYSVLSLCTVPQWTPVHPNYSIILYYHTILYYNAAHTTLYLKNKQLTFLGSRRKMVKNHLLLNSPVHLWDIHESMHVRTCMHRHACNKGEPSRERGGGGGLIIYLSTFLDWLIIHYTRSVEFNQFY